MAAIRYQIPFKSLRTDTLYTVNIWQNNYVGSPTILQGAAEPFTTEEDADEDPFTPVRTQSGYIRIVDNRRTLDGYYLTDGWWKDLIPKNDTASYVTLTHTSNSTTVIDWQGYLQAQTFGSEMYERTQERELPIQCPLTILKAIKTPTDRTNIENFAGMLDYMLSQMPSATIDAVYVSGGANAQQRLLKKFDWSNFLDSEGEADYTLSDVLEDACKYWGWTAHIRRTYIYLTATDDTGERSVLRMSRAQLTTMAGGKAAGTITTAADAPAVTLTDSATNPIFATTDNEDFMQRGPNKAVVKTDVNAEDTIVEVLPKSVHDDLDDGNFGWNQVGDNPRVGYFESAIIGSFDSNTLTGTADTWSGFSLRVIYPEDDTDNGTYVDIIHVDRVPSTTPLASLRTKRMMNYSGGSIKISGTVWENTVHYDWDVAFVRMRLGIGPNADRSNAKWFYFTEQRTGTTFNYGWGNSPAYFMAFIDSGGKFKGVADISIGILPDPMMCVFPAIPVPTSNAFGYLFIDIMGVNMYQNGSEEGRRGLQISDLKIEFTRDETIIPSSTTTPVGRTKTKDRVDSKEYKASNVNQTQDEWNADCIFASDANMKYGYGLLMNSDNTYMTSAPFGTGSQIPEQHLADRVAGYWASAKRRFGCSLRADMQVNDNDTTKISTITPIHQVTLDGTLCEPLAINRNWRDDVINLTLIEIPTA